jgi:hypothetical protein
MDSIPIGTSAINIEVVLFSSKYLWILGINVKRAHHKKRKGRLAASRTSTGRRN